MTDYAWGILTPFIALGGLALAIGAGWLLVAFARYLWAQTHYLLMDRVDLKRNLAEFSPFPDSQEPEEPEYLDAANKIRDALLESPRMYTLAGLGWRVLMVREVRQAGKP